MKFIVYIIFLTYTLFGFENLEYMYDSDFNYELDTTDNSYLIGNTYINDLSTFITQYEFKDQEKNDNEYTSIEENIDIGNCENDNLWRINLYNPFIEKKENKIENAYLENFDDSESLCITQETFQIGSIVDLAIETFKNTTFNFNNIDSDDQKIYGNLKYPIMTIYKKYNEDIYNQYQQTANKYAADYSNTAMQKEINTIKQKEEKNNFQFFIGQIEVNSGMATGYILRSGIKIVKNQKYMFFEVEKVNFLNVFIDAYHDFCTLHPKDNFHFIFDPMQMLTSFHTLIENIETDIDDKTGIINIPCSQYVDNKLVKNKAPLYKIKYDFNTNLNTENNEWDNNDNLRINKLKKPVFKDFGFMVNIPFLSKGNVSYVANTFFNMVMNHYKINQGTFVETNTMKLKSYSWSWKEKCGMFKKRKVAQMNIKFGFQSEFFNISPIKEELPFEEYLSKIMFSPASFITSYSPISSIPLEQKSLMNITPYNHNNTYVISKNSPLLTDIYFKEVLNTIDFSDQANLNQFMSNGLNGFVDKEVHQNGFNGITTVVKYEKGPCKWTLFILIIISVIVVLASIATLNPAGLVAGLTMPGMIGGLFLGLILFSPSNVSLYMNFIYNDNIYQEYSEQLKKDIAKSDSFLLKKILELKTLFNQTSDQQAIVKEYIYNLLLTKNYWSDSNNVDEDEILNIENNETNTYFLHLTQNYAQNIIRNLIYDYQPLGKEYLSNPDIFNLSTDNDSFFIEASTNPGYLYTKNLIDGTSGKKAGNNKTINGYLIEAYLLNYMYGYGTNNQINIENDSLTGINETDFSTYCQNSENSFIPICQKYLNPQTSQVPYTGCYQGLSHEAADVFHTRCMLIEVSKKLFGETNQDLEIFFNQRIDDE